MEEGRQKCGNVIKRANHIRQQFITQGQPYRLKVEQIPVMISSTAARQKQLIILSEAEHKTISRYFLKFEPLSFNPATFKDLSNYGGPKIAFNNNRMYVGTIVDGRRHGKGVISCPQGKIYQGEMLNNQRNGVGVQIYQQGNFYVGDFKDNKRHGKGFMVWLLEGGKYHYYKGHWRNGEPNGYGLHCSETQEYWGQFKAGVRSGKAIEITNRHIYEGQFANGVREGHGFLYEENVEYYQGQFRLGMRHGYGKWLSLKTCEEYEGFFQNDKKDGIGFYQRMNGFAYRGIFTEDKPSATGQILRKSREVNKPRSLSKDGSRLRTERNSANKVQSLRQAVDLKSTQISKQTQSKLKPRKQSQQVPQTKHLFGSTATIKQRVPLDKRKLLSSAKVLRDRPVQSACPESSQRPCKYKSCSCNKWDQKNSRGSGVDESRLKRLFSSRKLLNRQVV